MVYFAWMALSPRPDDAAIALGITSDWDRARKHCEEVLLGDRGAFLTVIEAVYPAMAVPQMEASYQRSGASWIGRLNERGGVAWRRSFVSDAER